ncbi:helix-turn-helix domain-containing protein [Lysobacter sp. A6]|uniref:Helix-turn-helix domain-containing protein n=1 Tax=Noviluteimonas lactosilytica TaxID=2888523 RepID=A0ABS8JLP8_9GAMM|nr:helix-turn-helix domain-containing protein [Lysobacter lactosilyticus]MCC8364497.1 helix-turn-helix domain-containing protein [Lysobacter lactosilyticus]
MSRPEALDAAEALAVQLRAEGHWVGDTPQYRVTRLTAARVLRVSEATLRNRASKGLRPDYYRVMGRVYYSLMELLDFMETRPDDMAA